MLFRQLTPITQYSKITCLANWWKRIGVLRGEGKGTLAPPPPKIG